MNYNGSGGGANGDDLSGLGDWAYRSRPMSYGAHGSPTARNLSLDAQTAFRSQQSHAASRASIPPQDIFAQSRGARGPPSQIYPSPPTQSNAPFYVVPPTPPEAIPTRSYAAVVSNGPRSTQASAHTAQHPQQQQHYPGYQQPRITPPYQPTNQAATPSSTILQRHHLQQPSYAEVAAGSQARTVQPNRTYYNPSTNAYLTQLQVSQQCQPGPDQWLYGATNPSEAQTFTNTPVDFPPNDTWNFNPDSDFPLFDDPMNRYMVEPTPFIVPGSLVINPPSTNARSGGLMSPFTTAPNRSLMSPTDSMDTSSMASSNRRTKKEIMEGDSGEYKCRRCGGGFITPDDRRHHEDRVHMPYEDRKHVCDQCGHRSVYLKDLKRHQSKHGDRTANAQYFCPFANCDYAKKGFARKDHLYRHLTTHYKADSAVQMSRSTSRQTFS